MNREILFKAKDKHDGLWVEGHILYIDGEPCLSDVGFTLDCGLAIEGSYFEIDKNTISQFTGQTDSYNNKIFENDIIRDIEEQDIAVVKYDDEKAMFVISFEETGGVLTNFDDMPGSYFEIIGNIHDSEK